MRIFFVWYLVCIVAVSCSNKQGLENPSDEFRSGKPLAELKNKKLDEVSGIAASVNNPGYLWTHNDSKNGAEVFLIDQKVHIAMTCRLHGIKNRDWEDITVGPGPEPGKNYVYVGEIGDNDEQYRFKMIYRFEEPVIRSAGETIDITDFDTITFRLPEIKDTETLMIDPQTRDLYVVSKREEPVHVYVLPYPYAPSDTILATEVLSLPLTQIVAGSISADGKKVLLKNYNMIYYWSNPTGKPLKELLKEPPQEVPHEGEPQGESITWAHDNSGFYTLSEQSKRENTYLYFYGHR
jgi:hypothetical protein